MKGNYCVYMHISPNNKRYIGLTSQIPEYRWNNGKGYINNNYFSNAINKYGWDNFQHIIIAKGLDEEVAQWLEIELIKEWDSANRDKGYNISSGGYTVSEETREKIRNSTIGENNHFYGKTHTEETKKKMSENHADFRGENHPQYGTHHSKETLEKISRSLKESKKFQNAVNKQKISIICLTTKRIFGSIKEASIFYNITKSRNAISLVCKGKRNYAGKFNGKPLIWRYLIWEHSKRYKIKK